MVVTVVPDTIREGVHRSTFAESLNRLLHQGKAKAEHTNGPVLISITEAIPVYDAIRLFDHAHQYTNDRSFWAQTDQGFTLVGLGAAQVIEAVGADRFRQTVNARQRLLTGALREGLRGLPGVGPLFIGGFSFDPKREKTALWAGFPDARLVLPQFLYTQQGDEAWITCNVLTDANTDADAETDALLLLGAQLFDDGETTSPHNRKRQLTSRDVRPAEDWKADVALTTQAIQRGELEKAVLARAVTVRSETPFDLAETLSTLSENYPHCQIFAIAQGDRCFLGATPERLVQLKSGELRTMALAGTARRGSTPEEDDAIGEALLNSAKDLGEHEVVVRMITEALTENCETLNVNATPTLLKLGNVQHLYTPITGRLAPNRTLLDIVERLHPTPAVGGRPTDKALELIREYEDMDRGWYAAPVGWIDAFGDGRFAVALRSGLVHGNEATLFAGCGIVGTSDPEREYVESCLKLKPMLNALAGE